MNDQERRARIIMGAQLMRRAGPASVLIRRKRPWCDAFGKPQFTSFSWVGRDPFSSLYFDCRQVFRLRSLLLQRRTDAQKRLAVSSETRSNASMHTSILIGHLTLLSIVNLGG